jgi:hypothetical protein
MKSGDCIARHISVSVITCLALVSVLSTAFVESSTGATLFYDGFVAGDNNAEGEYIPNASGDYDLQTGQNPTIAGFTGSWLRTGTGPFALGATPIESLNYPGVASSGSAAFRQATGGITYRALDPAMNLGADGTTAYFSFLLKLDDPTAIGRIELSNLAADALGGGIRIRSDGNKFLARVGFLTEVALPATDTNTHLFVFRADFGAVEDKWKVWMDPTDLSIEGSNTPAGMGTVDITSINPSLNPITLVFRRDAGGTAGNGFIADEVRLADTWGTDLFGVPVPEPSPLILILFSQFVASPWLRVRRR